jgi:sigma-54-specific transcriptional regulator
MSVLTLPNAATTTLSVRAKALVFEDAKTRALEKRIGQVAPSRATVLITGETGTGKEIVARHVHALSPRRDRPFVAVNCGSFADSLVESELFGHERGAFTGAVTSKIGWFEAAHGGTLFLDEIGDLPLSSQVKLLRVLQEGEVVRLGSRKAISIDVRLVAATNVQLEEAVRAGKFREDLYYRLNVATLTLPPLRERPGDILPLAGYFLELYRERLGAGPARLSADAERRLVEHAWPGNIRELENAVHHALLVSQGVEIGPDDLRLGGGLRARSALAAFQAQAVLAEPTLEEAFLRLFEKDVPSMHEHVEEILFRAAYHFCDKNQVQTAKLLGVSRNVVRARLIQYGDLSGSVRPPAPSRNEAAVIRIPSFAGDARRVGRLLSSLR